MVLLHFYKGISGINLLPCISGQTSQINKTQCSFDNIAHRVTSVSAQVDITALKFHIAIFVCFYVNALNIHLKPFHNTVFLQKYIWINISHNKDHPFQKESFLKMSDLFTNYIVGLLKNLIADWMQTVLHCWIEKRKGKAKCFPLWMIYFELTKTKKPQAPTAFSVSGILQGEWWAFLKAHKKWELKTITCSHVTDPLHISLSSVLLRGQGTKE